MKRITFGISADAAFSTCTRKLPGRSSSLSLGVKIMNQARKDAIADAETLRPLLAIKIHYPGCTDFRAAAYLLEIDKWTRDYSVYLAYIAREDAKAAFRAIPSLRESYPRS